MQHRKYQTDRFQEDETAGVHGVLNRLGNTLSSGANPCLAQRQNGQ